MSQKADSTSNSPGVRATPCMIMSLGIESISTGAGYSAMPTRLRHSPLQRAHMVTPAHTYSFCKICFRFC